MNDSRLWHIRRLATEAAEITTELRGEISPSTPEGDALEALHNYLSWVIARVSVLEAM